MVSIIRTRLEDGTASLTNGTDTIWVDDRLNSIQLLCAITHELIHIERGHTCRQTEQVEMAVRYETAIRLIPDNGQSGCKPGATLAAIAKAWGVTRQVLMDRAATLDDEQVERAGCRYCQKCPVMAARFAGTKQRQAA